MNDYKIINITNYNINDITIDYPDIDPELEYKLSNKLSKRLQKEIEKFLYYRTINISPIEYPDCGCRGVYHTCGFIT